VVGLPYPNPNDLELKEKMKYLDLQNQSGSEYYENLCMKAVNQSIGRSIRHAKDYASIILLDRRYTRQSVQDKLPKWIKSRLSNHEKFGPAFASIAKFFNSKKKFQLEFEKLRARNAK